jgi:hypothetical protein
MDDSWNPFDDSDDHEDRDDDQPRPFDAIFEFLSSAVDDDFDGDFHFEVHTGPGGAAGLGPDGDDGHGPGPGPGSGPRRGMGPASRRGHPRFGGGTPGDGPGGTDDPDATDGPVPEIREHDDATEVIADVAGTPAVGGDVSAEVIDDRLVVVTDDGTLLETALPARGRVVEVVERNGVLQVEIDHE